jgi:hypothetical protein
MGGASDVGHHGDVIDRTGEWWKGTSPLDIEEYLRAYTEDGYAADRFEQSRCTCSGAVFRLDFDNEEGCARRTCAACGLQHFICDSGEVAEDATLQATTCPCGRSEFDIIVGFSQRADGNVRWITVGVRCAKCGVLGCPVEWSIDHAPTAQLYEQV